MALFGLFLRMFEILCCWSGKVQQIAFAPLALVYEDVYTVLLKVLPADIWTKLLSSCTDLYLQSFWFVPLIQMFTHLGMFLYEFYFSLFSSCSSRLFSSQRFLLDVRASLFGLVFNHSYVRTLVRPDIGCWWDFRMVESRVRAQCRTLHFSVFESKLKLHTMYYTQEHCHAGSVFGNLTKTILDNCSRELLPTLW